MTGYYIELISRFSRTVDILVLASGGAGQYDDYYQATMTGGASSGPVRNVNVL